MRSAPMPDAVRIEVAEGYGELAGATGEAEPPVAVRSSALGEDSAGRSYAGQQESFLWVRGVDHVCDAVRDCWVSLFTPQAMSYRAGARVRGTSRRWASPSRLMVDAEVSGVMFTCNPVSGDPSMVAVNASWGLGIAVVGGELTPDDYLVSKVTARSSAHREHARTSSTCPTPPAAAPSGSTCRRSGETSPASSEDGARRARRGRRRIERHFGSHQDVEWAIASGRTLPDGLLVAPGAAGDGAARSRAASTRHPRCRSSWARSARRRGRERS